MIASRFHKPCSVPGMQRPRRVAATSLLAALAGTALLAAACTPAPSAPAPPGPPTVSAFRFLTPRNEAPVLGVLRFNVADPNNDALTCRIDIDGDGSIDRTFTPCTSADSVLVQIPNAESRTATIEVSDGEFAPVTASVDISVLPATAEDFEITLRLDPAMDPAFQQAFEDAALRWAQVITAGVPDVALDLPGGIVGWNLPFNGTVDDLLIDARDTAIDGPGKILGSAGGILIRPGNWLPYYGIMQFDTADLSSLAASGRLDDVILHEMGHVLGLGGSWALTGRINDPLFNPAYTGSAGIAAYAELGGTGLVPVENEGGAGTALGHWRESVFGDELMTGYLGSAPTKLSRLSVAALADQGYGVDLGAADPYSLPGSSLRAGGAPDEPVIELRTELVPPMLDGLP